MDRFRAWLQEKPWHAYVMVALTLGLFVLAYKSYRRGSSSSPFVSQTSAGMVDNAQYDELRNELAALQSYVQNPATPNAPTGSDPTGDGGPIKQPIFRDRRPDPLGGTSGWFTLPSGMSVRAIADLFHLRNGWTDLAYDQKNSDILPAAYANGGANVLPAGSSVYINAANEVR